MASGGAVRGADGRWLSSKVVEAIKRGRSPDLTPEQICEAAAPLPRLIAGEHEHRHFRDDGRGYVVHRHRVRSERHGHPTLGLAFTLLAWPWAGWRRVGGAAVYVGTVGVFVGFGVVLLLGFWHFAQTVQR